MPFSLDTIIFIETEPRTICSYSKVSFSIDYVLMTSTAFAGTRWSFFNVTSLQAFWEGISRAHSRLFTLHRFLSYFQFLLYHFNISPLKSYLLWIYLSILLVFFAHYDHVSLCIVPIWSYSAKGTINPFHPSFFFKKSSIGRMFCWTGRPILIYFAASKADGHSLAGPLVMVKPLVMKANQWIENICFRYIQL